MKILIPKFRYQINNPEDPFFFLIGPVRGGDDWQRQACELLKKRLHHFYAAIPYYHTGEAKYSLMEEAAVSRFAADGEFPRQLNWERYYIDYALDRGRGKKGCVIAWCPKESTKNPRPADGGPYACDTRGEIGEIRGRLMHDRKLRFVIGVEEGFHGRSQIERNFQLALEDSDFPVHNLLESTIEHAVEIATTA